MELRIMRLDPRAQVPARAHPGDAGLDLHSIEDATLAPGERASVGTGIAVEIPTGYAGLVLPRSGLAARHGIGARIAQLVITAVALAEAVEVQSLELSPRGTGGFGSSGS
jgi:dUTP pyrophosphatase